MCFEVKLFQAIQSSGARGRVRSESFSSYSVGLMEHMGMDYLWWFDSGAVVRMLSAREVRAFMTDGGDDWRPAN